MIVYRVYNIEGGYIEYAEIPEGVEYEIIDKSLTPEEIEILEDSKYPNTITAVQFELEVIYSGLKLAIDKAIEELEEPTKSIVVVKRTKATEFDRKDSFIQDLGATVGMAKKDINEFFLRASIR